MLARVVRFALQSCLAGCGTTLVSRPLEGKGESWTITLVKLKDGPDSYATGGRTTYVAPSGGRLLWATVTIRNDDSSRRSFNYDRCDLDSGDERVLPGLVDRAMAVNAQADDVEELDSGQQLERILIFGYPDGALPTRLSCVPVVIPLPSL